jgi:hypothetical protein
MSPQTSGQGDRIFLVFITWALDQLAHRGYITGADVGILAPAIALMLPMIPAAVIGWWKNRPQNIAADLNQVTADKVPGSPVQGVITTNNQAGRALADSIPDATIAAAGSPDAKALASTGAVQ